MQLITMQPDWFNNQDMKLIHRAFRYVQDRLGLTKYHETVQVRFDTYINPLGVACVDSITRDPVCMNVGCYSLAQTISAMFHEMVHVKQRVVGELNLTDGAICFRGRYFLLKDLPHPAKNDYNSPEAERYQNLPWEKEAFAKQEQYTMDFFSSLSHIERGYLMSQDTNFRRAA